MTPVWYAAKVNSQRRWLAWLLLCLLAFTAPAQAMNGLRLPMSAFSPGPKTACTAKPSTGDFPINKVDPSGLDPFGYSGAGVDDGIYANGAGNAEVAMGGPGRLPRSSWKVRGWPSVIHGSESMSSTLWE